MGHIHLGRLPASRKWNQVVALLDEAAAVDAIAQASAVAAERDFERAAHNPVFVEAVRLLAMIPQAARADDFAGALYDLGVIVPVDPSMTDLLTGTAIALDQFAMQQPVRNDVDTLAGRALVDALATHGGGSLPSLFAPSAADVKAGLGQLARPDQFSALCRSFFGRLTAETLSTYLDRTLSSRIGPGRLFDNLADRSAFDAALSQYCSEATRIIREFAGGWYGKTLHREGTITSARAASFGAVAWKKIGEELRRKRGADD